MTRKRQYATRHDVQKRPTQRKLTSRRMPEPAFPGEPARTPHSVPAALFGGLLVVLLVLGFALLIMMGHTHSSTTTGSGGSPSATVPVGYGSLNHPKGFCGNAGQAPCQPVQPGWFPITSEAPSTVAGAISHSDDFLSMQSQYGYVKLDTPALVHAYAAHTGIAYYDDDHWVVSVRNASGRRVGIFDFVYDRATHALRFSSYGTITPVDPHSKQAFPYIASAAAVQALQKQRGLQVKVGTQPELIFFPIDPNYPILTSPVHRWKGGGNSPMIPMWLVVGADEQNYFVGSDLGVYTQQVLPVAKGSP